LLDTVCIRTHTRFNSGDTYIYIYIYIYFFFGRWSGHCKVSAGGRGTAKFRPMVGAMVPLGIAMRPVWLVEKRFFDSPHSHPPHRLAPHTPPTHTHITYHGTSPPIIIPRPPHHHNHRCHSCDCENQRAAFWEHFCFLRKVHSGLSTDRAWPICWQAAAKAFCVLPPDCIQHAQTIFPEQAACKLRPFWQSSWFNAIPGCHHGIPFSPGHLPA
jgi:hypothetical protein